MRAKRAFRELVLNEVRKCSFLVKIIENASTFHIKQIWIEIECWVYYLLSKYYIQCTWNPNSMIYILILIICQQKCCICYEYDNFGLVWKLPINLLSNNCTIIDYLFTIMPLNRYTPFLGISERSKFIKQSKVTKQSHIKC